jgi:soluble lytic murein transglycosylase
MRWTPPSRTVTAVAAAGFLLGLFGTALWSADDVRLRGPSLEELHDLTRLEPVRVLPRTGLHLAALEARLVLDAGRPWAAWELLRTHLDDVDHVAAPHILLAARSAAGWGGWHHVRPLLREREWLAEADRGEGLFLLGRAEEELGNADAAIAAFRRYAGIGGERHAGEASARAARLLREAGDARGAAAAFGKAAQALPEIQDWLAALQVEQLGAAGDPSVAALAETTQGGTPVVRVRRLAAEAAGWEAVGDAARGVRRLEWEARGLTAQGAAPEAAMLHLQRARLLHRSGRGQEARELLRAIAFESTTPVESRQAAAHLLGEYPDRNAADELSRAAAYEAAGRPGHAARSLRAALAAGAPDDAGVRLRLARLLYEERDYGPARVAFQRAAEMLTDRELRADAELHAARSLFRIASTRERPRALQELRQVVERHPGTAAAGTALFLLGDDASSVQAALAFYRRAAAVQHSPDAREALFRVGDRSLRQNDVQGAIRAWEEYVRRFPRGEQTARVAYEVGKIHERAGRSSAARAMYTAATLADPISYHAIRAGNRLGMDPIERIVTEPRPWIGLAADASDAAAVLRRLDALDQVGLRAEWQEEYAAALRAFAERPAALIALAEGVRDRGYPVEAIRLGWRLLEARGEWDARLLQVVFPFLYRDLLTRESRRAGVDPLLYAALVRQESTFRPAVRSRVGATGLGQIMPATGRWLAPSVGIRDYEEKLLEVPEVNLRMGAKYFADLMRRYDGHADLALAGYNAGPARADRWRRELNHGRDTDAFREAIPFDETRHYVRVVLRNHAIYQRLYGSARPGELVRAD